MILYHASQEQFSPSELLRYAVAAKEAGFSGIHSSDHFHPWSERQGQSGFTFSWLAAALQATQLPCGMICAPGQRYHPAIVAQAVATLSEMFPQKFWLEVGSGEAINESITGDRWPLKEERNQRLLESVTIMRLLLAGTTVTHQGTVNVAHAKLYTLPEQPPPIIGAALSAETAAWVGSWADGMVTINQPKAALKNIVEAFKEGGGEGKPMYLKVQLSYAETDEKALDGAYDQWRTNVLPGELAAELTTVSQFDAVGEFVQPGDLKAHVHCSADLTKHIEWLKAYQHMGFNHLILHNVNREQGGFIHAFGKTVLPALGQ